MSRRIRFAAGAALVLLVVGGAILLQARATAGPPASAVPVSPPLESLPAHERFTQVLQEVVRVPKVDYAHLQSRREGLDDYVAQLGATTPAALERATRDEALAFWINAYNACMLKLVIDHYPIQPGGVGLFGSVRNRVAGYPENSVWQIRDVFTRAHCPVLGALRSQDEIEHEIIRPQFGEPRIHFAVNCAARSCPILWPEAYRGEELEAQLDRAVTALVEDPDHFRLESGPPVTLTLNKVLDWYVEDFGSVADLPGFFLPYLDDPEAAHLLGSDVEVRFFEYDWTLNDVPR